MARGIQIDPPIVVSDTAGSVFALSTAEEVIDYVRRYGDQQGSNKLREAAFIAAAVPSAENIDVVRRLAKEAIGAAQKERPPS